MPVVTVFAALVDDTALYRAVLNPDWYKNGKLKANVFMRRPPKDGIERDVSGLSVALAAGRDEATACINEAKTFNDCPFMCKITVGAVRALPTQIDTPLEFDVIQDSPIHANITGLPPVPPGDIGTPEGLAARVEARRIGSEMARCAVVVWTRP